MQKKREANKIVEYRLLNIFKYSLFQNPPNELTIYSSLSTPLHTKRDSYANLSYILQMPWQCNQDNELNPLHSCLMCNISTFHKDQHNDQ